MDFVSENCPGKLACSAWKSVGASTEKKPETDPNIPWVVTLLTSTTYTDPRAVAHLIVLSEVHKLLSAELSPILAWSVYTFSPKFTPDKETRYDPDCGVLVKSTRIIDGAS